MSDVSRETRAKLEQFAALLIAENQIQNLVARSTLSDLWSRHIDDAVQLALFAPTEGKWLDIGSGAGLPGMVLAVMHEGAHFTLAEPRRLRADFLQRVAVELGLTARVAVIQAKAEALPASRFDVITARAVASVTRLFAITDHLSHKGTIWVLPKGRSAKSELDEARRTWQGTFRLEPSRTDPDARILIATGVSRIVRARGVV